jgi:glycosyltransferase involved in cell wall biosynthesis
MTEPSPAHAPPVRVSVVIPCYNHAHYLPEAIAGVVAQTFRDWEAIIVDDGSPDDTAAVAARLIAAHPDRAIRLLRQPNRGLAASRNNAINVARGEYILPLDADDSIEPPMLAQTVAVLDARPEVGFVYTDVRRFGGESSILRCADYSLDRLRFDCLMMTATLFRKRAWAGTVGFRDMHYEDWDFWLSLAEAGWQGWHIAQPLVRYRRATGSMLGAAQRHDLELRARIVLNHPHLYAPDVIAWASRVYVPGAPPPGALRSTARWLGAFAGYVRLLARHQPRLLPRSLLRPLFWRLPLGQQGYARRLARLIRMT